MIRLTLATRPSVAPKTVGRRTLEPRVSWGLVGVASRARRPDQMAFTAMSEALGSASWREFPTPRRAQCSHSCQGGDGLDELTVVSEGLRKGMVAAALEHGDGWWQDSPPHR
jgi:hypothetical protein